MSKHNKKTARLLQGVALGLIIIATTVFLGCENPVGGAENNPLSDFAGKVYKSEFGELFSVTTNTVKLGYGESYSTEGKIVDSKTTDAGTVYLLECSTHLNYSPSQYPEYKEENPHTGCYLPLYIHSITSTDVEWAQFASITGEEPASQTEYPSTTTCFAHTHKEKAKEYLDLNNWTSTYTSTGIAQN